MSEFITIVIKKPNDPAGQAAVSQALTLLQPYQTGMSLDDEMTKLDFIENHPDMPQHLIDEAQNSASEHLNGLYPKSTPALTFSKSEVDAFRNPNQHLRWGQAFHQHFKLERCTQDKAFCDELYEADDQQAKAMVASRTDHSH